MSSDSQALAPASSRLVERIALRLTLPAVLLAVPILIFLAIFFFYPAINLLFFSLLTQDAKGVVGPPLTLAHYTRFFEVDLYLRVFWNTLRISLVTSAFAIVLGYPVAIVMAKSGPIVSRTIALIVIAPLIVSVVVRSYGWQLILANTPAGLLNWVLMSLGITSEPLALLYSETAVVIGSLHVFFPMMVLPLASALGKIDPNLEDCARTLGAPWWKVFLRVTLPLSVPGLVAGFTLVFSLTAGSFVTPVILGGTTATMLGNLIEQQIFVVYDWPFGAAIAMVLVARGVRDQHALHAAARRPPLQERVMNRRLAGPGAWILYFDHGAADGVHPGAAGRRDRDVGLRQLLRQLPAAGLHPEMVRPDPAGPRLPGGPAAERPAGVLDDAGLAAARRARGHRADARPASPARPS